MQKIGELGKTKKKHHNEERRRFAIHMYDENENFGLCTILLLENSARE